MRISLYQHSGKINYKSYCYVPWLDCGVSTYVLECGVSTYVLECGVSTYDVKNAVHMENQ